MPTPTPEYVIGVMTMEAEGKDPGAFGRITKEATAAVEGELAEALGVRVDLLSFAGPHLMPAGGAYAPLEFLRIGMAEKTERRVHFLLIVTEVDLAATEAGYTLALPSQLVNVAVASTKRLHPGFWGGEPDEALVVKRLTAVLLHCFGHLLNLDHHPDAGNYMHDTPGVDALAGMCSFTDAQRAEMKRVLPHEAHERTARGGLLARLRFTAATLFRDRGSIARAVLRANPLRLVTRLPTMITAGASVVLLIFFSPEPWDVGSTVDLWQLLAFSAFAVLGATAVLYRTFSLGPARGRGRLVTESGVVTSAAVALSLLLTMLLLFGGFLGATWLSAVTFFPRKLMETWPTVDPAVRPLDHLKLSLFVAGLGLLAGSLGGTADRKDLVRGVLFVDEEA